MAGRGGADREFGLYPANTTLGWSIVRRVSFAKGEDKVAAGVWRRVNDELGNHVGYQMMAARKSRVDLDLRSMPSSASISLREMKINAEGRSATDGLPGYRRDERVAAGRAPEDLVERVQRKVQVFPHVGAAKGDILRVWPLDAAAPCVAGV